MPTLQLVSEARRQPGDRPAVSASRSVAANPLLDEFREVTATGEGIDDSRSRLISKYGFAIPCEEAIAAISRCSPWGVVELGAGTGYWAHMLEQVGVDVVAFDIAPAPAAHNRWFAGSRPWHPVHHGDDDVVRHHSERTLLVVWPSKNQMWPATAVERYHDAGGERLVYVGEGAGGRTGDDVFHALLGELAVCVQCAYGSTTSPCICGVEARWRRSETVPLPHWPGYHDDLHIYTRRTHESPRRRQRGHRRLQRQD
jgi:hypothetical protein